MKPSENSPNTIPFPPQKSDGSASMDVGAAANYRPSHSFNRPMLLRPMPAYICRLQREHDEEWLGVCLSERGFQIGAAPSPSTTASLSRAQYRRYRQWKLRRAGRHRPPVSESLTGLLPPPSSPRASAFDASPQSQGDDGPNRQLLARLCETGANCRNLARCDHPEK